jgi:ankyrin repeat protein
MSPSQSFPRKADVNSKADNGGTALIVASKQGDLEVVQALLTANADVDAQRNDGTQTMAEQSGRSVTASPFVGHRGPVFVWSVQSN